MTNDQEESVLKTSVNQLKKLVKWEMDWSRTMPNAASLFPDRPVKEEMFNEEYALAVLLLDGVIFLNDHWWMKQEAG